MTSPILFVGGEDIDFQFFNCQPATTGSMLLVDTTAGHFRSGYARYGLQFNPNSASGGMATNMVMRTQPAFAASSFWFTARMYNNGSIGGAQTTLTPWRLIDASGVVRLRMRMTTNNLTAYAIEKVNAAGTVTQLGSNTSVGFTSGGGIDRIDVFVNYAVSGSLLVYINGNQIFSFTGDVTTDSVTTLCYVDFGQWVCSSNGNSGVQQSWSEIIVSTRDTRNMSLVTQAASATGNTDTFTGGAASNINGNLAKDTSPDFSNTAGQIQEYTVTPSMPTGNFSVLSVVQHARATVGASGPTKLNLMVRTGSADFTSVDQSPSSAWGLLLYNWDVNPNTTVSWQTTELPGSSSAFNFGYKSVT